MAISMSKRKSRLPKKAETRELCSCYTYLFKVLSHIPTAILVLIMIFLWSSTTTFISGHIVHVCVSSRKLNNLYCLSAGTQPNFEIPIPVTNYNSTSPGLGGGGNGKQIDASLSTNGSIKEIINIVSPSSNGSGEDTVNSGSIKKIAAIASPVTKGNEIVDIVGHSSDGNILEVVDVPKEKQRSDETDRIIRDSDKEATHAKKAIEEQIQLHRSWISNEGHVACERGGIYVYDLPTKFNKDLVGQCRDMLPWMDFCKYLENEALGEPIPELGNGWYKTHQYALELIFHARILKHPCRVYDENQAKLFYVPYYGGLDILRWHFKNVSNDVKDTLGLELMNWLGSRKPWFRNSGRDHAFVLGKISWDFRRKSDSPWGTRFLELEQMQNPIKLLIERQPWEVNDIGIPHPTFYHPHSDNDIIEWQLKTMRTPRKWLVSFAGAARPDQRESIRSILISQCKNQGECQFLDCTSGGCDRPETIIQLFEESEFCLQPPGDSPTRKSVFDSLVSGCIPVLFDPFTAYYQYPWHLPDDHSKYSVFIDQEEVRQRKVNVVERLMTVSARERENMKRYIVYDLLPGLVYGHSSSQLEKFQDAFTITVNNLFERANRL